MRVFVIGATGLLGGACRRAWSRRPGWKVGGSYFSRPEPGLRRLDMRVDEAVRAALREERPDVVVIPASNPAVDYCQEHPQETRRLNVDATLATARAAAAAGARVVFFSSDYVFDGERGGYREEDAPRPLCEYGRQKLETERGLAALGERVLILRVSALYGWEERPRNFVLQVLSRLETGEPVTVPGDQDYNPTYCEDLAAGLAELIDRGAGGLLHAAGSETLTRAALAKTVAEVFGFDASGLKTVPWRDLARGRAPRPLHSALDSGRLASLLGRGLWGARQGLERMKSTRESWRTT